MKLPFFNGPIEESNPEDIHTHVWELIARTFVEPKYNFSVANNDALTKLALSGATTLLFQCNICSEFRKEELPGLEQTSLDRILDRVETSGPEYITRNNTVYVLMKHPDSNSQQQGVPLRR